MKDEIIRIAVAETSVIVRSGVVSVLKHLPDITVQPMEVTSLEGLQNCMQAHLPDILIVNPSFGGWFNIEGFRNHATMSSVKTIALVCNITDQNLLKEYDESISLYDDAATISEKIKKLQNLEEEEVENEQGALSIREKEIIVYVVKGLMNKEIADQLHISIHTVITHRRNIARKLQIHSPAGLTIYAIVNKLVKLNEIKL